MDATSADTDEAWIKAQRILAEEYLSEQNVDHLGIGEWPAFYVYPYVALWAVQSRISPGWAGWWAITGDLPTDYISSSEARHPRKALIGFASRWEGYAQSMLRGALRTDIMIGTHDQYPTLADLLVRRAATLRVYADDDSNWD